MARVKSWISLRGSMGETTFKKIGDRHYANDKLDIPLSRIKLHSSFESLRRNGRQMGNASKSAKAIRRSLAEIITYCHDSKMANRFNAELMKVVRKDSREYTAFKGFIARGENMDLLQGFNFNSKLRLRAAFNVPYTTEVNRETGEVNITIKPFNPLYAIKVPRLATGFKIMVQVSEVDFDPRVDFVHKYKRKPIQFSDKIILENSLTDTISLKFNIEKGITNTVFVALGINFMDYSNPLYATLPLVRKVNAACIVFVDKGVEPVEEPVPEQVNEKAGG